LWHQQDEPNYQQYTGFIPDSCLAILRFLF